MPLRAAAPVLVCIVCSGGAKDLNGAFTVCVLCEYEEQEAA